jgi:hypothetical protein
MTPTPGARQHPELVVVALIAAPGEKGNPFPIGAPAGMSLLILAKGQCAIFGAVPLRHPEVLRLLVFRQVNRSDDIDNIPAIGRKARSIDVVNRGKILRLEDPFIPSPE